jgi:hypothetical protein
MAVTERKKTGIYTITWDWASSTAGAATEATLSNYSGTILRAIFDPDTGDTQPSAAYDVVVNDDDGYDVLHGCGANLANDADVEKSTSDGLGCVQDSKLTLTVSNAGESKGGIVKLYLLPLLNAY